MKDERGGNERFINIAVYAGRIVVVVVILLGIALRITEWFHRRDLMMDEVNVVRNVYERGLAGLLLPLDYDQYAPPLFLWMLKLCGWFWGYGEKAMRIYPLITSMVSLFLIVAVMKRLKATMAIYYPLAIFSFGYIYLRYANDVKQYAPDAMFALLIVYTAMGKDVFQRSRLRSFLLWGIGGAVIIWASMPSVFILASTGLAIFLASISQKRYDFTKVLLAVGCVWIVAFYAYYHFLLQQQIGSKMLTVFHEPYYIELHSFSDLWNAHNKDLIRAWFEHACGTEVTIIQYLNLSLLLTGIVSIFRKDLTAAISIVLPIFMLFIACSLHAFTLMPRVCIFIMPFILVLMGVGLNAIMSIKWPWLAVFIVPVSVVSLYRSQKLEVFKNRIEIDEMNVCIDFAHQKGVVDTNIYLPELYRPTLAYYKDIHPDKERRHTASQIQVLVFPYDFPEFRRSITQRTAFIYFWIEGSTLQWHRDSIYHYLVPVDSFIQPSYKVLVFDPIRH